MRTIVVAVVLAALAAPAARSPSRPAHTAIVLDDALRARWKKLAKDSDTHRSPGGEALRPAAQRTPRSSRAICTWGRWAQTPSCLVAWVATGKEDHAKTSMLYFKALLDDLEVVGDGKGGDQAAWRDSGFAIRAMVVHTRWPTTGCTTTS